jgi:ABC-2 type transport system ATP-binding protein
MLAEVTRGADVAPALETIELRKEYGSRAVVQGLSLTVERGEIFGFLGPNGAGKTTSIKMLMGLVEPTSGSANILGYPLGDLRARARIGFLPEQFRFHEWMRADEFLDFHAQLAGVPAAVRRQRIPDVLTLIGLRSRHTQRLRSFSKGMLQRIGLGQALINDPDLIFLDEPTSALDPIGRRDVRDIIHGLKSRGVTIFLNSHLLSEIEQVCDRVAILDQGRVVRAGPLNELLHQQLELEIEARPVTAPLLASLEGICHDIQADGARIRATVETREQIPRVAAAIIASGAELYLLQSRSLSLEDLFVETVEEGGDR